jgi:hypothetical protein
LASLRKTKTDNKRIFCVRRGIIHEIRYAVMRRVQDL